MTEAAWAASFAPSEVEHDKPWKGRCCFGCFVAKTDRKKCKCRCRGEHHGKGQQARRAEKGIYEFFEQEVGVNG